MKDTIFREYDIRGIVGEELYIDEVYNLSRAIAALYVQRVPDATSVVIGMDVRTHSPEITVELCKGFLDSGIEVIFLGTCTSPMLYFALHTLNVGAGLMVTASHNPKEYNGIKICFGTECLWGNDIQIIKQYYKDRVSVASIQPGIITNYSVKKSYIQWLYDQFSHLRNCTLSMVFDCGNGAAGIVLPALIEAMGWHNVQILCAEPDGTFPNHEADPIVEENMRDVRSSMLQFHAQIGIGFDGDADRMCAMTPQGELVSGDKLLAVFAQHIVSSVPHLSVVYDINATSALGRYLEEIGAQPILSPCGHSIVQEYMQKYNALLGGELSCHFFFNDRGLGFDDGIYAAFRLLEILQETEKTLDQLLADFPDIMSSKQYRLPCKEEEKQHLIEVIASQFKDNPLARIVDIDGIQVTMPYGRGLIRSSNTQALICFRFESDTQEGLNHIKRDFASILADVYTQNLYTTFDVQE